MKKTKQLSLIAIYGASGAGKTTLTDLLHGDLSYTARLGTDHIKRFISEFRTIESHNKVSRKVINAMAVEYLKNGISVIVEQGMERSEIEELEKIAKENGAKFFAYSLNVAREIIDERVTKRSLELGKQITPKEKLDFFHKRHLDNDYPHVTATFDTGMFTSREIADQILNDLI
ncbi:MAG: AAA family ATPase [bacterium]